MKIILDHTEIEAPQISTFYFRPERPVSYKPGQYVELTLPHTNMDNRGDRRPFALSSSPTEEFISITNKFAQKDGSSFKHALSKLQPGAPLTMSKPKGSFILPDDETKQLVFIAGGIGITPFRSMAQWLATQDTSRDVRLFYAVNHENDAMFLPILERAIPHITIMVSNPSTGWTGARGYLDSERILCEVPSVSKSLFYVSGPEGLVDVLRTDLERAGIQKSQLVIDPFTGYFAA
jgi:ferredoxin-NADP reductase